MVSDGGNGVFYDECGIGCLMMVMQPTFKMNGCLIKMVVDGLGVKILVPLCDIMKHHH